MSATIPLSLSPPSGNARRLCGPEGVYAAAQPLIRNLSEQSSNLPPAPQLPAWQTGGASGYEYTAYNQQRLPPRPHSTSERLISSTIVHEELLTDYLPQQEQVRYVEIPIFEETVRRVPRREIVDITRHIPQYDIQVDEDEPLIEDEDDTPDEPTPAYRQLPTDYVSTANSHQWTTPISTSSAHGVTPMQPNSVADGARSQSMRFGPTYNGPSLFPPPNSCFSSCCCHHHHHPMCCHGCPATTAHRAGLSAAYDPTRTSIQTRFSAESCPPFYPSAQPAASLFSATPEIAVSPPPLFYENRNTYDAPVRTEHVPPGSAERTTIRRPTMKVPEHSAQERYNSSTIATAPTLRSETVGDTGYTSSFQQSTPAQGGRCVEVPALKKIIKHIYPGDSLDTTPPSSSRSTRCGDTTRHEAESHVFQIPTQPSEILIPKYIEHPMVVAQSLHPVIKESELDVLEVEMREFNPYLIPVDVMVPRPIARQLIATEKKDHHRIVDVPPQQFNELLRRANPDLPDRLLANVTNDSSRQFF